MGPTFNHGYVVGLNASWPLFDGFATRGRMQATRARRDGAILALKAVRLGIESEVRSAFLDLEQADSVLQAQTKNVQTADESLAFARSNFAAGLGTQLDILQAAADVDAHPNHAVERDLSAQRRAGPASIGRRAANRKARLGRACVRTAEPNDAQPGEPGFSICPSPATPEKENEATPAPRSRTRGSSVLPALRGLTLDEALRARAGKNPRIQQAKTAVEQAAGQRLVSSAPSRCPTRRSGRPVGVQGASAPDKRRTEPFALRARFLSAATLSRGNSGLLAAWRHRSAARRAAD